MGKRLGDPEVDIHHVVARYCALRELKEVTLQVLLPKFVVNHREVSRCGTVGPIADLNLIIRF